MDSRTQIRQGEVATEALEEKEGGEVHSVAPLSRLPYSWCRAQIGQEDCTVLF